MGNKIERRFLAPQVRAESTGDEATLVGYAACFSPSESDDLGGFRETINPAAFTRSLREGDPVVALVNHNPDNVLGHTRNKTLTLETDDRGLKFRCMLPPTQNARDAYALVKRGDVVGCSFSFITRKDTWNENARDGDGVLYTQRRLDDVQLLDVSPVVTFPAYSSAGVLARAALFPYGEPEEVRAALDRRFPGRKHLDGSMDEDEIRRIRLRIIVSSL
jgi:HK97 family phage prohead protease